MPIKPCTLGAAPIPDQDGSCAMIRNVIVGPNHRTYHLRFEWKNGGTPATLDYRLLRDQRIQQYVLGALNSIRNSEEELEKYRFEVSQTAPDVIETAAFVGTRAIRDLDKIPWKNSELAAANVHDGLCQMRQLLGGDVAIHAVDPVAAAPSKPDAPTPGAPPSAAPVKGWEEWPGRCPSGIYGDRFYNHRHGSIETSCLPALKAEMRREPLALPPGLFRGLTFQELFMLGEGMEAEKRRKLKKAFEEFRDGTKTEESVYLEALLSRLKTAYVEAYREKTGETEEGAREHAEYAVFNSLNQWVHV